MSISIAAVEAQALLLSPEDRAQLADRLLASLASDTDVDDAWSAEAERRLVPVAALFENLEGGASVAEFVEWFPGVTLEQAKAALDHVAHGLLAPA